MTVVFGSAAACRARCRAHRTRAACLAMRLRRLGPILYMEAQLARAGTPSPQVIGIDVIAIRKGHTYRIVVSDLLRGRPIWFGGKDRSQESLSEFYAWLGETKSARI